MQKKETISLNLRDIPREIRNLLGFNLDEDNQEKDPDDMSPEEFNRYLQKMNNDPEIKFRRRQKFIKSLVEYDTMGYKQCNRYFKIIKDQTLAQLTIDERSGLIDKCFWNSRFDILFELANVFHCGNKCGSKYENSNVKCESINCMLYTNAFRLIMHNSIHDPSEDQPEPDDRIFIEGFKKLYRYFEYDEPEPFSDPDFDVMYDHKFKKYGVDPKIIRTMRLGTNDNLKLIKILRKRGFL
jgi:hypothetical protein